MNILELGTRVYENTVMPLYLSTCWYGSGLSRGVEGQQGADPLPSFITVQMAAKE